MKTQTEENTKFKPIKSLGVAKAFLIVPFRWISFKSICGYLYTVVSKFFWLQFSVKLGFRKIPVLPVDNALDKKVPFVPLKVPVYLDFIHFWIRPMTFILNKFGTKKSIPYCARFLSLIDQSYFQASRVYSFRMSTTDRPMCKVDKSVLGHFINKLEDHLEPLIQETAVENLGFIAGDCLIPGTANMDFFSKRKILKELNQLDADYVILDLGAGSAYNTLDFFLVTYKSILVTTPEITSILNAYSFLKSSAFRFFAQQFSAKSEERKFIQDFTHTRIEGTELSFVNLMEELYKKFPESSAKAINKLDLFRPQVILNKGRESNDIAMGQRLKSLVKNKLNMNMEFIGFIPHDDEISLSIARRTPLILSNPEGDFARRVYPTAQRIIENDFSLNDAVFDEEKEDEVLQQLVKEFSDEE
ncbi:MAG: hypothetical protein U0K92_06290 [Treponema sp.]|nr:hypothetical protein [Treponema sp.]